MRILVVDDEKLLVKGITFNLENDGYEVDGAYDGGAALSMLRENSYDLIILDLMLPVMDGLSVRRTDLRTSHIPIIMITAPREGSDKLIGFEYGADDYVAKPFDILELKARIRVIMRRSGSEKSRESVLAAGHIRVDGLQRAVMAGEQSVELTAKEFDLLVMLMKNQGRVCSRESLLNSVWGYEYPGDIRTVDTHIRRLREKLELDDANPEYILTKWGVGYYFKAQEDKAGK